MSTTINFSALEARDSFQGTGNLSDMRTSKEFTIFAGAFFLVGDIFEFPPASEIRIYLSQFKKNLMPVANIGKNGKLDWRPIKSFCRIDSQNSEGFFQICDLEAKKLGFASCNREFIECGDCATLMESFAGATVKVVARVQAQLPKTFVTDNQGNTKVTEYKTASLPVFARM